MKKRILLTGSRGFIGRYLFARLISLGFDIVLVLKNTDDNIYEYEKKVFKILWTNNIFKESVQWWEESCFNVDIVINLAWYTNHKDYIFSINNYECMNGSLLMVQGAIKAGVKTILGIGTCLEYDFNSNSPASNTHKLLPKTIYGFAKMSTYLMTEQLIKGHSIKFIWCRPFFLFGEGESEGKLSSLIKSSAVNGNDIFLENAWAVRDFIEINDAVEIIIESIIEDNSKVVNICSGKPVTILNFSLKLLNQFGGKESQIKIKRKPHKQQRIENKWIK